jgi:hypothetical protein
LRGETETGNREERQEEGVDRMESGWKMEKEGKIVGREDGRRRWRRRRRRKREKSRAAFALIPKLVIPQKKYQNGKLQVLEQTIISKRALHTSP